MLRAPILPAPSSRSFRMNPELQSSDSSDEEVSAIGSTMARKIKPEWSPFTYAPAALASEDPRAPTPVALTTSPADDAMPQENQSFDDEIAALGLDPATTLREAQALAPKMAAPKAFVPQAAAMPGPALKVPQPGGGKPSTGIWSKDKITSIKTALETAKPASPLKVASPAPKPTASPARKEAAAACVVFDKPEGYEYVADPKQPDHIVQKGHMLLKPSIVFSDVRFTVNEARKFTTLQTKTALAAFKQKASKLLNKATAEIASILAANKGETSAPYESYASNQQLKIAEIAADLKHATR